MGERPPIPCVYSDFAVDWVRHMKELGEQLRAERESQGLSQVDLARKAGISTSVLRSIEDGRLEWIGTPMLIRGFIRNYCNALGLDPAPLLEKYSSAILSLDQQERGIQRYRLWNVAFRVKRRLGVFSLAFIGLIVVVALYSAVWISNRQGSWMGSPQAGKDGYPQEELPVDLSKRVPQLPPAGIAPVLPSETDKSMGPAHERSAAAVQGPEKTVSGPDAGSAAVPAPRGQNPQESVQPPESSPVVRKHMLTVEVPEWNWIKVKIDGKGGKSIGLEAGKKQTWEVENNVQVVMGNMPGIHVTWDERPVRLPEKSGKVMRFTLPD